MAHPAPGPGWRRRRSASAAAAPPEEGDAALQRVLDARARPQRDRGQRERGGADRTSAWASTTLTPTARRRVLLPDMFDPVTRRNVPGGPIVTSFRTRVSSWSSGWPSRAAR